jgi:hypothetical protein
MAWLTALAVPGTAVLVAVTWLSVSSMAGATGAVRPAAPAAWAGAGSTPAISPPAAGPSVAGLSVVGPSVVGPSVVGPSAARLSPAQPGGGLVLSPSARRSCPHTATACADLKDHITWLQSGGRITYGPVPMEPGARKDPTPRGIWHVAWKAGAHYISTSFGVPIPYAVFFAPGGIAFHAGSLKSSSHGCIHLRLASARYFHNHLPDGAEVAVF